MKIRKLGNSDLDTSEIGLGCMTMAGIYGPADDDQSIATIHAGIDAGVKFIDTADAYGGGANEILVGKAISDRRDKVLLATKFGNQHFVKSCLDRKADINAKNEMVPVTKT